MRGLVGMDGLCKILTSVHMNFKDKCYGTRQVHMHMSMCVSASLCTLARHQCMCTRMRTWQRMFVQLCKLCRDANCKYSKS